MCMASKQISKSTKSKVTAGIKDAMIMSNIGDTAFGEHIQAGELDEVLLQACDVCDELRHRTTLINASHVELCTDEHECDPECGHIKLELDCWNSSSSTMDHLDVIRCRSRFHSYKQI